MRSRENVLQGIDASYTAALANYAIRDLTQAESEFVKVIKPALSKPAIRQISLEYKDTEAKAKILDSMYHLGLICLESVNYHNNYAKAAAIFQYCAGFSQKHKIGNENFYLREAYYVEQKFLQHNSHIKILDTNYANYCSVNIKWYRDKIFKVQKEIKSGLAEIYHLTIQDIDKRASRIEELYRSCSNLFVHENGTGILQALLDECYAQLGWPPAEGYTIIGLGSMSLGTITPWSDVEFAILISDDKEEIKEYFRNLTKLLHIKVVNLGTTHLRSIGIEALNDFSTAKDEDDWFWDDIMPAGISFDGSHWHACKSPLGRTGYYVAQKVKGDNGVEETTIVRKQDYELILTPAQMASFQEKKGDTSWFHSDKHLVQSLKRVCFIDGSVTLLDEYRKAITKEEQVDIFRARELEILSEDLAKFGLKIFPDEDGKLIDIKKDIYRLGDRILVSLANYYRIFADEGEIGITIWQILKKMETENIFRHDVVSDMRQAVSIAVELRLSTYLHNKGQKETVSTYEPAVEHLDGEQKQKLIEETFYIKDLSILYHFYDVMFSVQAFVTDFCEQRYSSMSCLIPIDLYKLVNSDNFSKGMVRAKFFHYSEALVYLKLAEEQSPNNLRVLESMMQISHKMSKIDDAIKYAEKVTALTSEMVTLDVLSQIDLAKAHMHQGCMYVEKKEYDLALPCFNRAVLAIGDLKGFPHRECVVAIQLNMGSVYFFQHQYDQAIECYEKAIDIMHIIYASNPNHVGFVKAYSNLASVYNEKKDYDQAKIYHKKALDIDYKCHANNPNHQDTATTYISAGLSAHDRGEYDLAIDYYNKALRIMYVVHAAGNMNHQYIGGIYLSLANAYYKKEEYDTAIVFYKKSLSADLHESDIPGIYDNIGKAYGKKEEYDLAVKYHDYAFNLRGSFSASKVIAINYYKMARILGKQEEKYEQAIEYYKKSLDIMKMAYESNPFEEIIAAIYLDMAFIYRGKEQYAEALECYQNALVIKQKIYGDDPYHQELAFIYNLLADAYDNNKEYDKAIKFYHKALQINEILNAKGHELYPHGFVITIYVQLAKLYRQKDEKRKFIYHAKMVQLLKQIYEDCAPETPSIAEIYSRIGKQYISMGKDEEAIEYLQKSLKIQLDAYKNIFEHPEIAQNYFLLTMAYGTKKALNVMLDCIIKAHKIILHHPAHQDFFQIETMFIKHIIPLFAEHYSLDIENVQRKIFEYIDQDNDFTDPYAHYSKAEELYDPLRVKNFENAVENYVLALALLYPYETDTRDDINMKLASLGVVVTSEQLDRVLQGMPDLPDEIEAREYQAILHYTHAESYAVNSELVQNSREALIEYLLALIFLPHNEVEMKEAITAKVLDLGMSPDQLESWSSIPRAEEISYFDSNIASEVGFMGISSDDSHI